MMCCEIPINDWKAWRGVKNVKVCPSCGLGVQYPMPDSDELQKIYGESYYDSWGDDQTYWGMKESLYRSLIKESLLTQKGTILDVGCATGACLKVAQEMGWQTWGIDVNEHGIDELRKKMPGANAICCNLENAPLEHNFFDLIIMSDVIEHVTDPEKNLKKVYNLLKVGGVVVILTPDISSWSAAFMGKKWIHIKHEHLFYFSRKSMQNLISKVGFEAFKLNSFSKPVTLQYANTQLQKYPLPIVSGMIGFLSRCIPMMLQKKIFWMPMGEMVVCGRKIQ